MKKLYIECPKCYDTSKDKLMWESMENHVKYINLRCQDCLYHWKYELHQSIGVEKDARLVCF